MMVGGYIGYRVDVDGLAEKVKSFVKSNPHFAFTKDETKHMDLAFGKKVPRSFLHRVTEILEINGVKNRGFTVESVECLKPIVLRTPYHIYSLESFKGKIFAENLVTGESGVV